MTPFENYLTRLHEIRSTGEAVDETSYYDALSNFFNEVGKSLKPRVHCILQLRNRGVGNPDGGLFTQDQLKKHILVILGKGKLAEREYTVAELKALLNGANVFSSEELFAHLGDKTCDVYLNETAYWSNIPIRVWEYMIGGYQVIKKWLSYREEPLLGRPLTKDEVRYVQEMARRIAAILLLEPALYANYESIKQHTFSWPRTHLQSPLKSRPRLPRVFEGLSRRFHST